MLTYLQAYLSTFFYFFNVGGATGGSITSELCCKVSGSGLGLISFLPSEYLLYTIPDCVP